MIILVSEFIENAYFMKIRNFIFIAVIFVLLIGARCYANPEYQVKAAFLYNFIMFVDWPEGKLGDSNAPIVIGIIGENRFEDALEPLKDKQVKDRKIVIKQFKRFVEIKKLDEAQRNQEIAALRSCHLLFISGSEQGAIKEITDLVKDYGVLTIGETESFPKAGDIIINFIIKDEKVRFEINLVAAKEAKLQIRSQLLRLAEVVIGDKTSGEAKE